MRSNDTIMAEGREVRPPGSTPPEAVRVARSRRAKPAPTTITIETTPQVAALLDRLASSGLYPLTRAAVAEELLRTALREIEVGRLP